LPDTAELVWHTGLTGCTAYIKDPYVLWAKCVPKLVLETDASFRAIMSKI
jgi:hypothetical protein